MGEGRGLAKGAGVCLDGGMGWAGRVGRPGGGWGGRQGGGVGRLVGMFMQDARHRIEKLEKRSEGWGENRKNAGGNNTILLDCRRRVRH